MRPGVLSAVGELLWLPSASTPSLWPPRLGFMRLPVASSEIRVMGRRKNLGGEPACDFPPSQSSYGILETWVFIFYMILTKLPCLWIPQGWPASQGV